MPSPKIVVCVPTYRQVEADFAGCLALAMQRMPGSPLVMGRSTVVTRSRENCMTNVEELEAKIGSEFSHVFFIDSDMVFPPDAALRLAAHDKDIVAAAYPSRQGPTLQLMVQLLDQQPIRATTGVFEVRRVAIGCCLFRREVFHKLPKPYFRFADASGDTDEGFVLCDAARSQGYKVWVDVDLTKEVGHIGQQIRRAQAD